jgi:hypothetical protein
VGWNNNSYHQIPLAEAEQPTTTFITPFGCFCYVKMSFRLKNIGATYQRCMQFYFKGQIGRNLEVYVDDIIVKYRKSSNLIADLEESFNNLRQFNIKLNSKKCTFEVPRGKLLGYIITERYIEANPDKISAIVEIGQVRNIKDVQWLMGCLAALSCFVSRLGERGLPLYKLLKKSDSFRWTDETQKALDELKAPIFKSSVLASLEPGETLLLYVMTTTQVISAALVVEREEPEHVYKVHMLVYYINKVLSDCETHYNQVQKLLYAILITKRKLLHYF